MISRIWHGWTTPDNADRYEALLKEEVFIGIENMHVRGFRGIQLLRRDRGEEVEFVTIMTFDSLGSVVEFAGEDYEIAYVPAKAREVLSRFDERSQHYEIRAERGGSDWNRVMHPRPLWPPGIRGNAGRNDWSRITDGVGTWVGPRDRRHDTSGALAVWPLQG